MEATPDYYIVLDFEATCDDERKIFPIEVIEFPSVLIDAKSLEIVDEIQIYVKPIVNPELTPFCTELTGIQQAWVDEGLEFSEALDAYENWLGSHGLLDEKKGIFITCGDWDLSVMMHNQMNLIGREIPDRYYEWTNIKHIYKDIYDKKAPGMAGMLDYLNIELTGKHHSGIDDCRNIAKIVKRCVVDSGNPIRITSHKHVKNKHEVNWIPISNGNLGVAFQYPSEGMLLSLKGPSNVQTCVALSSDIDNSENPLTALLRKVILDVSYIPLDSDLPEIGSEKANECQIGFRKLVDLLNQGKNVYLIGQNMILPGLICYRLFKTQGMDEEETLLACDKISKGIRKKLTEEQKLFGEAVFF